MSAVPQIINYKISASAFNPRIYEGAVTVVHTLKEHQHQAFFVGGCVRDVLMGLRPNEIDIATSATPEEIKKLFKKVILVGERFGVCVINIDGNDYHVSTFREDVDYKDGRHPSKVLFSTPQQDAERRDFTINALFWEPVESKLYDYTGGLNDLHDGVIRAVGDPMLRFQEDRLRILRCARFAAHLGYAIDKVTYDAMSSIEDPVKGVSAERIRDEMDKMLKARNPSIAFELLYQVNALQKIIPELCAAKGVPQPPTYHPEGDVWTHTMIGLDLAAKELGEKDKHTVLLWAILLHDIAKPSTISHPQDENDRIRFNGHDVEGESMARVILERLKFPKKDMDDVCSLIKEHMRYGKAQQMRKGKLRSLMEKEGELFESHIDLNYFDTMASHGDLSNWEYLKGEYELFKEQKSFPKPIVDGRFLMDMGMKPSPKFSLIIDSAREAQLEGDFKDKTGAKKFVKNFVSSLKG